MEGEGITDCFRRHLIYIYIYIYIPKNLFDFMDLKMCTKDALLQLWSNRDCI